MSGEQDQKSERRLYFLEEEHVVVDDFDASGHVLDLGGGGEKIIGRLKGGQVVAIDASREEALRVLLPSGRFLIWGLSVPDRLNEKKDVLVLPLLVELPAAEVETGYGIAWPEEPFGVGHYVELARRVGFEVVERQERGRVFHLSLRKP